MRKDIGEEVAHEVNRVNGVRGFNQPKGVNGINSINGLEGVDPVDKVNATATIHISKHVNRTSTADSEQVDVLIVGAGFSGVYLLYQLRRRGFTVKVIEAGSDLGGVWHWNRYPGARVDSQYPMYSYSLPEVYEGWNWSSEYPDWEELQRYFHHIDAKLGIKKDCVFHTKVTSAEFEEHDDLWTVVCNTGKSYRAQYFVAATGFAAKRYVPDFEGIESFKGIMHHSSFWPNEHVDVRGLNAGVLGTGSSGIQITQEWANEIGETGSLKMFQRTPNLCCPMKQKFLTLEQQKIDKLNYREWFDERWNNYGGFRFQYRDKMTFDDNKEERLALYEELWEMGGFRFLMNNYFDMTRDTKANDEAYNFWREKIRLRIKDHRKAELLAPMKPPHPFGAKRLSLEQNFYEGMNRPNVDVVDVKAYPILRFEPEGIRTADGVLHELDVIAIATGFDSITGGIKDIEVRGRDGQLLTDKWAKGTWTYLGMTTSGFPNFFFTYGPHAPTAFSNGPACVELQSDWIVDLLVMMREKSYKTVDAKGDAEQDWRVTIGELSAKGLRHFTDSWYNGSNIPGKPREPLNYAGGLPLYRKTLNTVKEDCYRGLELK